MKDVAGRMPAHDLDAEGTMLGNILDRKGTFDMVSHMLSPEYFYSDANRQIYEAAVAAKLRGAEVNLFSVKNGLRDTGVLPQVGGEAYLHELAGLTAWSSRLEDVARVIRDKYRTRRLVGECQRIAAEGYGDVGDVNDWINASEAAIHAIAQDRAEERLTTMRESLQRVFAEIQNEPDKKGLRSGLRHLDNVLGPMKPGQLVLVGALSGVGKSALALNMALYAALAEGMGVLVFSAEMEADELSMRALFSRATVDSGKVNWTNGITQDEWAKLAVAAGDVAKANIWIDDSPSISPAQIRAVTRRIQSKAKKPPLGLIVVDYVQLLDGKAGLPRDANREREVAEISRSLKVLAKEASVPVLALAQLNSDSEKAPGGGRKPRMNDLRESKAIAQNADKIILIHNPHMVERAETYRDNETKGDSLPAECVDLIVAKNRGGRTGTVPVKFWPSCTLFESFSQEELEGLK